MTDAAQFLVAGFALEEAVAKRIVRANTESSR